jgi:aldehyde dehydrogenase (NAD+)
MRDVGALVRAQREFFHTGKTRDVRFRKENLKKLRDAVKRYEPDILTALKKDLNKPELEAYVTEIGVLLEELNFAIKHVEKWAKPKRTGRPLVLFGSRSYIYPEPHGVCLIISPWNYPFQLALAPLVGAIAAGNCAVIKPSEYTPHVSRLIQQMLEGIFDREYVAVVEGGPKTGEALLDQPFDYIFFTGSISVGRIVMEKASRTLTPVTLELGGKSPAIVTADANLDLAAKRIVWGKFTNAGQTCVAPDYLYVHESVKDALLERMKDAVHRFYGENPLEGSNWPQIVNDRHFKRLKRFLEKGEVVIGGEANAEKRMIAPTILDRVSWEDPVMEEEIFGPILPVLTFGDLDEAIAAIREKPRPLALYLFSENKGTQDKVIRSLPFGGGCINDTLIHFASPNLPFGGTGTSGIGKYHGRFSFEAFSHSKSVVKQTTRFDFSFRYPNAKSALRIMKRLMG